MIVFLFIFLGLLLNDSAIAQQTDERKLIMVLDDLEEDYTNKKIRQIFAGSIVGFRYRFEDANGLTTRNQIQHQIKLTVNIDLTENLQIQFQPQTGGDGWSSGWTAAVPFNDGSKPELGFHARRLFLNGGIGSATQWQIGALPSHPEGVRITPLAFDNDGWIDGGRVMIRPNLRLVGRISLTLGSLDTENPDFFSRSLSFSDRGFLQVKTSGDIVRGLSYMAEFNRLPGYDYARTNLTADLRSLTRLLVSYLVIENTFDFNGGQLSPGSSLSFFKESENWRFQLSGLRNDLPASARALIVGQVRPPGTHAYVTAERKIGDGGLRWFANFRRCLNSNECGQDFRFETGLRKRL